MKRALATFTTTTIAVHDMKHGTVKLSPVLRQH